MFLDFLLHQSPQFIAAITHRTKYNPAAHILTLGIAFIGYDQQLLSQHLGLFQLFSAVAGHRQTIYPLFIQQTIPKLSWF